MWGIQFVRANNSLICASADFETRTRDDRGNTLYRNYRVVFGPHNGLTIFTLCDGEAAVLKERAGDGDLEAILPQGDFGHRWTHSDFMIALTFFDEGYSRGYSDGAVEGKYHDHSL